MGAGELEARINMREGVFLPVFQAMAIAAGGTEAAFVRVVLTVAISTRAGRIAMPRVRFVTAFTTGQAVCTAQREVGAGVVELVPVEFQRCLLYTSPSPRDS